MNGRAGLFVWARDHCEFGRLGDEGSLLFSCYDQICYWLKRGALSMRRVAHSRVGFFCLGGQSAKQMTVGMLEMAIKENRCGFGSQIWVDFKAGLMLWI